MIQQYQQPPPPQQYPQQEYQPPPYYSAPAPPQKGKERKMLKSGNSIAIVVIIVLMIIFAGIVLRQYRIEHEGSERKVWIFSTGLSIYYSSAAIGPDGTIYFGTGNGLYLDPGSGHGLYALNPDGSLRWKCGISGGIRSTPALGSDGTIYFVVESNDRTLAEFCAVTSDGSLNWTYTIGTHISLGGSYSTPAIASDGTIYVVGEGLFAFNPNGSIKWQYALDPYPESGVPRHVWNSPSIAPDGAVYVVMQETLYALHPNGTVKWEYVIMENPRPDGDPASKSTPAIGSDGTIYFGDEAGIFHALDPDGNQIWTYDLAQGRVYYPEGPYVCIRSSPCIGADGTIYVGAKIGPGVHTLFAALNPDGTLKWIYEPNDRHSNEPCYDIYSSPAIGSDGTIYFGCETDYVYALNPDGTLNWKFRTSRGMTWPSPAISSDGTLYIGNMDGDFYAIDTDSEGGLADTPWPKFHKDNFNTGRF